MEFNYFAQPNLMLANTNIPLYFAISFLKQGYSIEETATILSRFRAQENLVQITDIASGIELYKANPTHIDHCIYESWLNREDNDDTSDAAFNLTFTTEV